MDRKTYKREVAAALLVFTGVIAVWAATPEGDVNPALEVLKVIIWPVFLFAGAAWGMEWATKQTDLVRR